MPAPSPPQTLLALVTVLASACAHRPALPAPAQPVQPTFVHHEMAGRYRAFFPAAGGQADPDPEHDLGILRPRFGLPAIIQVGAPFEVDLLEHSRASRGEDGTSAPSGALLQAGAPQAPADLARCLQGLPIPGCFPLRFTLQTREPVEDGASLAQYQAQAGAGPAPGPYDLYLNSAVDSPVRIPKAVWLRALPPDTPGPLRIAHLSDLHVGKHVHQGGADAHDPGEDVLTTRLHHVLAEVNAEEPDLVVVTGDLVNRGQDERLAPQARALLLSLNAPVLVVMGNHDIEFGLKKSNQRRYGVGWSNFARVFHPYLHFLVSLGGYDFVGFDSGPSERSPRVLTRGLAPTMMSQLAEDTRDAAERGQRGVVFFSHAPTRATVFAHLRPHSAGLFGRMHNGSAAFEHLLLAAAARGQLVLHLAGHTHWSDVFEATQSRGKTSFSRWPSQALSECPRAIHGRAALITTQAAAHSGLFFKDNARGYGFAMLTLGAGDPTVALRRFGVPPQALKGGDEACPLPAATER